MKVKERRKWDVVGGAPSTASTRRHFYFPTGWLVFKARWPHLHPLPRPGLEPGRCSRSPPPPLPQHLLSLPFPTPSHPLTGWPFLDHPLPFALISLISIKFKYQMPQEFDLNLQPQWFPLPAPMVLRLWPA